MGSQNNARGQVLTFDVSVALLLMFGLILVAQYYFTQPSSASFDSQLLRGYLQDSANVMAAQGYFGAPLASANESDSSGIRSVIRSLPNSVCMDVSAYGDAAPNGLAASWKMDEGAGMVLIDSSGNEQSGSLAGPSWSSQGRAGSALVFSGASQYATLPSISVSYPFTLSMWVKPNAINSDYRLIGARNAVPGNVFWAPSLFSAGAQLALWDGVGWNTLAGSGVFTTGNWYHIVVTVNSSLSARAYINGVGQAPVTVSAATWNVSSLSLGSTYATFGNYYNGAMDEVRLYNRVLTSQEINALYSNPQNRLYLISRQNCNYAAGELQTLEVPFAYSNSQEADGYATAVLRVWQRGVG